MQFNKLIYGENHILSNDNLFFDEYLVFGICEISPTFSKFGTFIRSHCNENNTVGRGGTHMFFYKKLYIII